MGAVCVVLAELVLHVMYGATVSGMYERSGIITRRRRARVKLAR